MREVIRSVIGEGHGLHGTTHRRVPGWIRAGAVLRDRAARYRDSFATPTLIEPGKVYEYHIEMNPTGHVFLPGHRIRLDISSSDFPNFDRNHNTGGDDYCESTLVTAQQTVSHDMTRPSRIVLPVIPA